MFYSTEEKIFSLSRTVNLPDKGNLNEVWFEFFCYLLVTGFAIESQTFTGWYISSDDFRYSTQSDYNNDLTSLIFKGLSQRFNILKTYPGVSENHRLTLAKIDGLFNDRSNYYIDLSVNDILAIAHDFNFTEQQMTIAHYVGICFGQKDFVKSIKLPRLYLSVFGNIHLSKDDFLDFQAPTLKYRSKLNEVYITALWAMLAAITKPASTYYVYIGDYLNDLIASFGLLSNDKASTNIGLPKLLSILYFKSLIFNYPNEHSFVSTIYDRYLFSCLDNIEYISRLSVYKYILNHMVNVIGVQPDNRLYSSPDIYNRYLKWANVKTNRISSTGPALEVLKDNTDNEDKTDDNDDTDNKEDDTTSKKDDVETDPAEDTNGYDPSSPPPAVPTAAPSLDKNNIDIISFDKTGEGVSENLYRDAVVALNTRLQRDTSLPIKADVKEALNYWVNGFLYRTSISATKDQIAALKLEKYLKNI